MLFPPSEGFYPSPTIPVRGTVTPYREGGRILVTGGAGEISAAISEDGSWLADAVPLADGESAEISVRAVNGDDVVWDEQVSALLLDKGDFSAERIAIDSENRRLFISSDVHEIQEFMLDTGGVRIIDTDPSPLTRYFEMLYFPLSGELLRIAQAENLDCIVLAHDVETGASRELYRRSRARPAGACGSSDLTLTLSASGESLFIVDGEHREITELDLDGEELSKAELSIAIEGGGVVGLDLHIQPSTGRMFIYAFDKLEPGPIGTVRIKLFELDYESGDALLLVTYEVPNYRGGRTTNSVMLENNIYGAEEGLYRKLSVDSLALDLPQPEGFIAHRIQNLVPDPMTNNLFVLDSKGTISRLNADSNTLAVIHTVNPYDDNNVWPADGYQTDRSIFVVKQESRLDPGFSDFSTVSWENLYRYDLDTFALKQVMATPGDEGALCSICPIEDERNSIVGNGAALARFDRDTREAFDLNLPYDQIGEIDRYLLDSTGRFLVIVTEDDSVIEIDLSDEQIILRQMTIIEEDRFSNRGEFVRSPGPEGEVYVARVRDAIFYRVNFSSGRLEVVSGPSTGDGPLPPRIGAFTFSADGRTAWVEGNHLQPIWKIDLTNGNREPFLETDTPEGGVSLRAAGSPYFHPPTDAIYFPARDESSSDLYQVDPVTSARVELPVRFVE